MQLPADYISRPSVEENTHPIGFPSLRHSLITSFIMDTELEILEDLVQNFEKFKSKQDSTVQEIQEEMAAKGATLKQIMEQLQQIQAKSGSQRMILTPAGEKTTQEIIKEALAQQHGEITKKNGSKFENHKFEIKQVGNMTASANLTGSSVVSYADQPALRNRRKIHFRDLVAVVPSATGTWVFYRQNKPVGEGSFDFQTTHGAVKNQLDYDLTAVTVTVDYLAGYTRIAKQMLTDLPFMQSFISGELVEDYLRTEDRTFFMQVAGGATASTSGVTSTVTAEKIIQAIASLREQDQDPNGIVVTHAVWAKLLNTKPADYSLPGGNAVTIDANGNMTFAGIPVIPTLEENIGANRMLIGDWNKAKIIQTEGLSVEMYPQDQDNAIRNLVTVVCEARVNLAMLRLDSFMYLGAGNT